MRKVYTIVDDFVIADARVLALSEERQFSDFNTPSAIIDGVAYPYGLTHNDNWITIKNTDNAIDFTGKTLTFE